MVVVVLAAAAFLKLQPYILFGWSDLSRRFPDRAERGSHLPEDARMIRVDAGTALSLRLEPFTEGLRLRIVGAPFFKPVFVPWSAVELRRPAGAFHDELWFGREASFDVRSDIGDHLRRKQEHVQVRSSS